MKARELMEILSHVDPESDVILSADAYDSDLDCKQVVVKDGHVELDLSDYVDDLREYYEMLAAL